jgi:hypothetical protein
VNQPDAETLRRWATAVAHLTAECPRRLLRLGLDLHGEIAEAATKAEAEEAAFAEYVEQTGRELARQHCPLCGEPLNGETNAHAACVRHEQFLADCPEQYLRAEGGEVA